MVIQPHLLVFLFFTFQMFVLVPFWFQLYNGFSGSNAIDDMSLILFNLAFTAVPPVICGILDKDVPDHILSRKPALYKSGQNSEVQHKSLVNMLHSCYVIYQTRETVFHRDIQIPRRELRIRRGAEYFRRNSRCLDSRWNTVSSVWSIFSIETKTKE